MKAKMTWPAVVLAGIAVAGVIGILWVLPKGDTQDRAAIIAVLSLSGPALVTYLTQRVSAKVDRVAEQVNGRMSALISAKTQQPTPTGGDVSRETSPDVSRETDTGTAAA